MPNDQPQSGLRPIDVEGRIDIQRDADTLTIVGHGSTIVAFASDLNTATDAISQLKKLSPFLFRRLRSTTATVAAVGLTIELRVGEQQRLVARIGTNARSRLLRWIGFPHVECHSLRLLRNLWM